MSGAVDHPDHYGGADSPYEAIKVVEAWNLDFYLVLLSQKVAFCEVGIIDKFGRFVFRHEELRWITQ
jgi:hypothetical protein